MAASRIKGITVEIGGDTTGLQNALKGVNSTIKTTQSSLKDVNKLLKLDPTNTELLSQKQKLLKEAIGATSDKLETLKTAQAQAKQQMENGDLGKDKYDALQREIMVDGYVGFLYRDKNGMPEVAMHWQHRFNHAVKRYNDIFRVQMPNITPHVCRHTYCSNQARAGMNPKTLQYLMGHSDIGITMNTYTHLGLDDAKNEMIRLEELEQARKEVDKVSGKKELKKSMFKIG